MQYWVQAVYHTGDIWLIIIDYLAAVTSDMQTRSGAVMCRQYQCIMYDNIYVYTERIRSLTCHTLHIVKYRYFVHIEVWLG